MKKQLKAAKYVPNFLLSSLKMHNSSVSLWYRWMGMEMEVASHVNDLVPR